MSQSSTPPLDPVLVPQVSENDQPKPKRDLVLAPKVAKFRAPAKGKKRRARKVEPTKYTLADAFDYFYGPAEERSDCPFQSERCVRAVAFLLRYSSEYGNEEVIGSTADGLAHVLEQCATKIAQAEADRKWLREHGGKS